MGSEGEVRYFKYGIVLQTLKADTQTTPGAGGFNSEILENFKLKRAVALEVGDWICEPVLWTRWVCVGDATAVGHVSMLAINTERLKELIESYPMLQELLMEHANMFVLALNCAEDPSDLFDTGRIFLDVEEEMFF